ncbi:unnamed protein product, partial [Rotaria sordida]
IIWLIIGTVWIADAKPHVQFNDSCTHPENYCERSLFICTLVTIIIKWTVPTLFCILSCLLLHCTTTTRQSDLSLPLL